MGGGNGKAVSAWKTLEQQEREVARSAAASTSLVALPVTRPVWKEPSPSWRPLDQEAEGAEPA